MINLAQERGRPTQNDQSGTRKGHAYQNDQSSMRKGHTFSGTMCRYYEQVLSILKYTILIYLFAGHEVSLYWGLP